MPGTVTRNLRLVLEYDGTDLCGWQQQTNGPTVQQHVQDALAVMCGQPVKLSGASRTDAGVHAVGQVANFKTNSDITPYGFRRGLNSSLPESIAVLDAREVSMEFDSRFSARGKHYRYDILARPNPSPLSRHRSWHRSRPLDPDVMRAAAEALVGEHDFSAFRATGCQAATATRTVTGIRIDEAGAGRLTIHVRGNAFLRKMVRIIAGTLVDIGEGRWQAYEMTEILASCDRTRAGQTAPARGLTLVEVFYP